METITEFVEDEKEEEIPEPELQEPELQEVTVKLEQAVERAEIQK